MPATKTFKEDGRAFRGSLWIGAWLTFLAFHVTLMTIDWHLRDHRALTQPMPGGVSEPLDAILTLCSFLLLGAAAYSASPRTWPTWKRLSLTLVQEAFALALFVFARGYYILTNGIDTL
jgi:uncharacterized membrane protein YidH (DUF202 family)